MNCCLIKHQQILLSSPGTAKIKIKHTNTEWYYRLGWFSCRLSKYRFTQSYFLSLKAEVQKPSAPFPWVQSSRYVLLVNRVLFVLFCILNLLCKVFESEKIPAVSADWNGDKMDLEWQDAIQREVPSSDVIHCLWSEPSGQWGLGWSSDLIVRCCTEHVPAWRLDSSLRTVLSNIIIITLWLFVVPQSAGADQLKSPLESRTWFSLVSIWPPFLLLPSILITQHNGDEICT